LLQIELVVLVVEIIFTNKDAQVIWSKMMFVCGQLESIRSLGNGSERNRVFLQELTIAKLVNKFSAYCAKRSLLPFL